MQFLLNTIFHNILYLYVIFPIFLIVNFLYTSQTTTHRENSHFLFFLRALIEKTCPKLIILFPTSNSLCFLHPLRHCRKLQSSVYSRYIFSLYKLNFLNATTSSLYISASSRFSIQPCFLNGKILNTIYSLYPNIFLYVNSFFMAIPLCFPHIKTFASIKNKNV